MKYYHEIVIAITNFVGGQVFPTEFQVLFKRVRYEFRPLPILTPKFRESRWKPRPIQIEDLRMVISKWIVYYDGY